jgi:prepilin-type N-terminal cleavage/methylation domain-containing protein
MICETGERGEHGYTLVELLMVVVLIGLLASTAAMASGGQGESRLNLLETQLADALEFAQSRSQSTRTAHGVVFEPSSDRFGVIDEAGALVDDPLTRRAYVIDLHAPNQPYNLDLLSVDFGAAGSVLLFDSDGLPLTSGQVLIQCGNAARTLILDEATGRLAAS